MLNKKRILITGGTGFFGTNFAKYLLKYYSPEKIIIFSRDETKQYEMEKLIKNKKLKFFIGDVRDLDRLKYALREVDIVVHAAALKHVPATEYNPTECIKTNILGAQNIIDATIDYNSNVKKVVALSTDKAVNPVNIYGASKLAADKLFVAANNYKGKKNIKFSVIRYGNVLESRGSVIPFFLELKKNGSKYLPVTHKDMTRFFITIEDGIKFVIQGINNMCGGEIFIPKIPSFKIIDLAKAIHPKAKIKIVGVRSGEKIHETLLSEDEFENIIEFKKYFTIVPKIGPFGKKLDLFYKNINNEIGKKIQNSFSYNSKNNRDFLDISGIKKYLNFSEN